jgi:hypothetical protein
MVQQGVYGNWTLTSASWLSDQHVCRPSGSLPERASLLHSGRRAHYFAGALRPRHRRPGPAAPPRLGHTAGRHRRPGTAPRQHPHPNRGAAAGQLGDQAGLAHPGLAPHQDDGRVSICGPPPGRLQELQLLDAANQGRARHTAAHLAGIIPRDRPEGNGSRTGPATKDRERLGADVWHLPDSG